MVYVRIELWPGGDRTKARLLQEATIANVGGDAERGDYAVGVSHSTTYKGSGFADPARPKPAEVWKAARITNHARKLSPFHLVCKAVGAAIGATTPTPATAPDDGATVARKRRFDPDAVERPRTFQPAPAEAMVTRTDLAAKPAAEPVVDPCPYCRKAMPANIVARTRALIYENRNRRDMTFCSPGCATHYQMGAEG
jgi:hypothetical protein